MDRVPRQRHGRARCPQGPAHHAQAQALPVGPPQAPLQVEQAPAVGAEPWGAGSATLS